MNELARQLSASEAGKEIQSKVNAANIDFT